MADATRGTATRAESGVIHRPDLDGVRALAVGLVLAYHLQVRGVLAGWIGVDVFFVLSGFFITGTLLRDHADGTASLRAFWARRVRRLVPTSAVVLVATCAALWWRDGRLASVFSAQARATAVYGANLFFATHRIGYGAPDSPFQHFWSLALEEQFYLVWPIVVLVGLGRARWGRRGLGVATVVVAAGSLAFAIARSTSDPLGAFYLLPGRAWELCAGAGAALAIGPLRRLPSAVAAASGWAGIALILYASHHLGAPTIHLVSSAVLPVAGALALVAGGAVTTSWGPARLLALRPVRWIGRMSYGIYLWHLPLIIFGLRDRPAPYPLVDLAAVCLGSVVLAWLTYLALERPIRWRPSLIARPLVTIAGGVAVTAVVFGVAVLVTRARPLDAGLSSAYEPTHLPPGLPADAASFVPSDLQPPLATAFHQSPPLRIRECQQEVLNQALAGREQTCPFGDVRGTRSIALFGDSHALQWWAPFDAVARRRHLRLYVFWRGCGNGWIQDDDWQAQNPTPAGCGGWRAQTEATLRRLRPEAIFLSTEDEATYGHLGDLGMVEGAERSAKGFPRSSRLVVIRDAPAPVPSVGPRRDDPPVCLAKHLHDIRPCDIHPTSRRSEHITAIDEAIARAIGATFVDPTSWVCPTATCPAIRGHLMVWIDSNHLTTEFARSLAPDVDHLMRRVLRD